MRRNKDGSILGTTGLAGAFGVLALANGLGGLAAFLFIVTGFGVIVSAIQLAQYVRV